jgi:Zn-dependent alcohol dehydrogenase
MGAGGVGMNAVHGASLSGASHVVVVDPAPSKKTWAPRFGATEVYDNFAEADAFIKSITDGQGADSAIVSIGVVKNEHIGQAFGAVRTAGTVVVVGVSNEREGAPVPGFNAITVPCSSGASRAPCAAWARPAMRCPTWGTFTRQAASSWTS